METNNKTGSTSFRDAEFGYLEVMLAAFSLLMCLVTIFYLIPNWIDDSFIGWPTPRTFPYTTCAIHAFLCTIWLVNSLFGRNIKALSGEVIKQGIALNAVVIMLCFIIYHVGYLAGGTLATASIIVLVNGPKRWKQAVLGSVCIGAVYYFFFSYVMKISLPKGFLM